MRPAARSADAGPEPRPVPPEPIAEDPISGRDIGDINKNSPFAGVLRLGQPEVDARSRRSMPTRDHEEIPDLGDLRQGTPTSAARRNTIWRSGRGGRCLRDLPPSRSAFPATGCAPSATARNFRSIRHDEAAWAKNRRAQFVLTSK